MHHPSIKKSLYNSGMDNTLFYLEFKQMIAFKKNGKENHTFFKMRSRKKCTYLVDSLKSVKVDRTGVW